MDLLISGATVLTMDADLRVLPDAFVGITGGKISFLGKAAPVEKPKKIMDATGLVLMPGLIDTHCHLTHSILRNYRDDLPPLERLETQLLPKLDRMDRRIAAAAATLSIAEALQREHLPERPGPLLRSHRPGRGGQWHQMQSGPGSRVVRGRF